MANVKDILCAPERQSLQLQSKPDDKINQDELLKNARERAIDVSKLPIIDAIPAGDYDPDEDTVWEALA